MSSSHWYVLIYTASSVIVASLQKPWTGSNCPSVTFAFVELSCNCVEISCFINWKQTDFLSSNSHLQETPLPVSDSLIAVSINLSFVVLSFRKNCCHTVTHPLCECTLIVTYLHFTLTLQTRWRVQGKTASGWRATRTKRWILKRCAGEEKKKESSYANRNERSR